MADVFVHPEEFGGEDYPSEPSPSTLRAIEQAAGYPLEVGALVTGADCPEGKPAWAGVVIHSIEGEDTKIRRMGARAAEGTWTRDWRVFWRLLTDAESLAIAAWLLTGDPDAEWDDEDEGSHHLGDDDCDLWSCPSPEGTWGWGAYVGDDRVGSGVAASDEVARACAVQALLAHICRGAQ